MPGSYRLIEPITAAIELPTDDLTLSQNRLKSLANGGVKSINLIADTPLENTFKHITFMHQLFLDIAITVSACEVGQPSIPKSLTPLTIRIKLDNTDDGVISTFWLREVSKKTDLALVAVLPWLGAQTLQDWLCNGAGLWFSAINILDPECSDRKLYHKRLKELARFCRSSSIPVLSDIPLLSCFGVGSGICPAGRLSCFIDRQGNLRPCLKSDLCIGCVDYEQIIEMWQSLALEQWACVPDPCLSCPMAPCLGGCRSRAESGKIDPMCPMLA